MKDRELAVRMLHAAVGYEEDAQILAGSFDSHGNGSAQLSILSLEILLKCARLLDRGERRTAKGGHDYFQIWSDLSPTTQREILDTALARARSALTASSIQAILDDLQEAFELARYPYDILRDETEASIAKRGAEWNAAGAPLDQADFRFRPEEIMTLIHGLRTWIEAKLQ